MVADDNDVINHMIALGESLEPTRREKFMGWYHSHPFEYVLDRSHWLPMGVAGSPDIFQSKMSELMAALEFVRTYLDDPLCITKGSLEDHLEKLRVVLTRLQDAGLKVNADKSKFCAYETEYLGYVLTRDGIKPQINKVQSILALKPPTNVKELRQFFRNGTVLP